MIKQWYSSTAIELAKMIDVSDALIREVSNGVVSKNTPYDEEDGEEVSYENTPIDEKIFGKLGEENVDMLGHIELPAPIVNVQYINGRSPELSQVLGMNLNDIIKIVGVAGFIDTEDNWNNDIKIYPYPSSHEIKATYITGGEAIEALLKFKGVDPTKYILRTVPVMPLCMRYVTYQDLKAKCEDEIEPPDIHRPTSLDSLYERAISRAGRVARLAELDAPSIIMINEKRCLQYAINNLINNGVEGVWVSMRNGMPRKSLDDLYEDATKVIVSRRTYNPEFVKELEAICSTDDVKLKWDEYSKMIFTTELDDNGNEYHLSVELDDEGIKLCDERFAKLLATLNPLVARVHEKYFSQYDYSRIPDITSEVISDALEYWDSKKESAVARLLEPVAASLDLHYRKRYMWESKKA